MSELFIIRRRIEIDAAHRVPDHKSKCFHVHGHRYVIEAECEGHLYTVGEQKGMVLDFGFLKQMMMEEIHDPCDHGFIIYKGDELLINQLGVNDKSLLLPKILKVFWVDAVPTAENLARIWYNLLAPRINECTQGEAHLRCLRVWETPNSLAVYPVS